MIIRLIHLDLFLIEWNVFRMWFMSAGDPTLLIRFSVFALDDFSVIIFFLNIRMFCLQSILFFCDSEKHSQSLDPEFRILCVSLASPSGHSFFFCSFSSI